MYKLNDNRINNEFIYKMNLSGLVKRPKLKLQFFSIAIKMYELNDNRINNEITYKD